jgi:hypothetical protein
VNKKVNKKSLKNLKPRESKIDIKEVEKVESNQKIINTDDLEKLAGLGLTEKEICLYYDISLTTLQKYKKLYDSIVIALKRGVLISNNKVVESLYRRAIGFSYKEMTRERRITSYKDTIVDKKKIKEPIYELVITKEITKQFPPEVSAICFWLKNRSSETWKERLNDNLSSMLPEIPEPYANLSIKDLETKMKEFNESYEKLKKIESKINQTVV